MKTRKVNKQCQGEDHNYNPITLDGKCVECGGLEPSEANMWNEVKHTPTPWRTILAPTQIVTDDKVIATLNADLLAEGEKFANAEFIVRAVNTHDETIRALKGVLHHNNAVKDAYKLPESLIRQIETAIAKAEGKGE